MVLDFFKINNYKLKLFVHFKYLIFNILFLNLKLKLFIAFYLQINNEIKNIIKLKIILKTYFIIS